MNKRTPVVVGLGIIQQHGTYDELDEALILMEKATLQAIDDCGNPKITNFIDIIDIPKGFWAYRDPGKWIGEKHGFQHAKTSVNKIGVLQQHLINSAALRIQNGEIRGGLILGGESRAKMIAALKEKKDFKELELNTNPDMYVKAKDDLYGPQEAENLGLMAVGYYAVLESAMRAHKQHTLKEHEDYLSKMYADFSEIAAKNPHAWNRNEYQPNEISQPSAKNKPIAYPYNKLHNTSWNVNQASAMIIIDEEIADKLQIPQNKRSYPLASSETNHMLALIERPSFVSSAGLRLSAAYMNKKISNYGKSPSIVDLYSCFPVAIQQCENVLELDSSVPKTITGGMPFAGGPLNNYMLHATVQALLLLRQNPDNIALITGISGMMTKQAFGLWSGLKLDEFTHLDTTEEAEKIDLPKDISTVKSGDGHVIGYTVLFDQLDVVKAVIYIEDLQGKRKVVTSNEVDILKNMREEEWVGKAIKYKDSVLVS